MDDDYLWFLCKKHPGDAVVFYTRSDCPLCTAEQELAAQRGELVEETNQVHADPPNLELDL